MLLRTFAAAVIAGMASLPLALAAGVAIGVVEAVLFYNNPADPGLINAVLLVIVLVAVLVVSLRQRGLGVRERFSFAPRVRPIPPRAARVWWVRHHTRIVGGLALLAADRAAAARHRPVPALPLRPGAPHGAGRPVAHRAHRLGRAALARPVRARRPRRHDHLQPRAEPAVVPGRHGARRADHGARRGDRGRPGPADARPVPRRQHAGPGGGGTRGSCPGRSSSTPTSSRRCCAGR